MFMILKHPIIFGNLYLEMGGGCKTQVTGYHTPDQLIQGLWDRTQSSGFFLKFLCGSDMQPVLRHH